MLTELGYAAAGAIAGVGGMAVMFKFLNSKIDKKQNIDVCNERSGSIKFNIERVEKKIDKSMVIQGETQVSIGQILQELKHFNGKT